MRGIMTARKVEGGFIEIQLPATTVEEVSLNEKTKLLELFAKALGKTVAINYTGKGGKDKTQFLIWSLCRQISWWNSAKSKILKRARLTHLYSESVSFVYFMILRISCKLLLL